MLNFDATRLDGAVPFSTHAMMASNGSCCASAAMPDGGVSNSPACVGPPMYQAAFMEAGVPVQCLRLG